MRRSTPWREADFCVIDLETTGLDPAVHEIVSFATVGVSEGRVMAGDATYRLVRPRHMPGGETIRIHGLRESDLMHSPPLEELLDELLATLDGRVLVAHVAAVETGFLSAALATRGERLRNPVVDTAGLALELRHRRGKTRGPVGLGDIARSLGLPVHRPHHADGDALTTAQVFLALATHLEAFRPVTVGRLVRWSRRRETSPLGRAAARLARLRP